MSRQAECDAWGAIMTESASGNIDVRPGKLPMWQTVKQAYAAFFGNFGTLLKIALPWVVLAGALTYLSLSMMIPWQTAAMEAMKAHQPPPPQPVQLIAVNLLHILATVVTGAIVAVAWHRLLLLKELPRPILNPGRIEVWRYVGAGIAMTLLMVIPFLLFLAPALIFFRPELTDPSGVPLAHPVPPSAAFVALFLVGWLATMTSFVYLSRLMLALPARAIGDNGLRFRSILERTKGNSWRIIGGMFFCSAPLMILAQLAVVSVVGMPRAPSGIGQGTGFENFAALFAAFTAYMMLVSMIYIGFLSFAYRHFFETK
jgi:hypothetical protein